MRLTNPSPPRSASARRIPATCVACFRRERSSGCRGWEEVAQELPPTFSTHRTKGSVRSVFPGCPPSGAADDLPRVREVPAEAEQQDRVTGRHLAPLDELGEGERDARGRGVARL